TGVGEGSRRSQHAAATPGAAALGGQLLLRQGHFLPGEPGKLFGGLSDELAHAVLVANRPVVDGSGHGGPPPLGRKAPEYPRRAAATPAPPATSPRSRANRYRQANVSGASPSGGRHWPHDDDPALRARPVRDDHPLHPRRRP